MRRPRAPAAFTLIEVMVVAAIFAVLLVAVAASVRSMMQSNQRAQAENMTRGALMGARAHAMHHGVVAGVRFQDDGSIVPIRARGGASSDSGFDLGAWVSPPVCEMESIPGSAPTQLPGNFRVTCADFAYEENWAATRIQYWNNTPAYGGAVGAEYSSAGFYGPHPWYLFPVVLFEPTGKLAIGLQCTFPDDWHPAAGVAGSPYAALTAPTEYAYATDASPEQPMLGSALVIFDDSLLRDVLEDPSWTWNTSGMSEPWKNPANRANQVVWAMQSNAGACFVDHFTGMISRGQSNTRVDEN